MRHWELCKRFSFPHMEKWFEHCPEKVLEDEEVKVLWDFAIQTDHRLEHNKLDIVVHNKSKRECIIIDIACPFDTRIVEKEDEKIEKYQDLKYEIKKIWKFKEVTIVPIVIGALGTLSKNVCSWMDKIEMREKTDLLQKACLLGTAKIIRRTLDN